MGKIFQVAFYIFSSYVSFIEKNVKFYYCHSIEWFILVERVRETEKLNTTFSGSVGHICQEKKNIQSRKLATAHAQFCFSASFQRLQLNYYLMSSNMQQLILLLVRHPSVGVNLFVFQDIKFVDFFHGRKTYEEVWKKKHKKTLLEIFAQGCRLCTL